MKKVVMSLLVLGMLTVGVVRASDRLDWYFLGDSPILANLEGPENKIFLLINQGLDYVIMDASNGGADSAIVTYCTTGEDSEWKLNPIPIKINNNYVKFKVLCVSGKQMMEPLNEKAKADFKNTILSGEAITVEFTNGGTFHFPKSNVKDMREKLAQIAGAQ
ncbi:hypothetical protein [Serratia fonticola]